LGADRQNIQEDQRIIVVDAEGFVLGLVVDHVHEVLNVPKNLMEPPPRITSSGGMELSGVAKLDDGSRLIMLLDVANLMKDKKLRDVQGSAHQCAAEEKAGEVHQTDAGAQELSEVQLVTFLLGAEEYGIPISQIQEIDRLAEITKVPKAAQFIEGSRTCAGK
jgi:purine-binding chemotaxis protein CheW